MKVSVIKPIFFVTFFVLIGGCIKDPTSGFVPKNPTLKPDEVPQTIKVSQTYSLNDPDRIYATFGGRGDHYDRNKNSQTAVGYLCLDGDKKEEAISNEIRFRFVTDVQKYDNNQGASVSLRLAVTTLQKKSSLINIASRKSVLEKDGTGFDYAKECSGEFIAAQEYGCGMYIEVYSYFSQNEKTPEGFTLEVGTSDREMAILKSKFFKIYNQLKGRKQNTVGAGLQPDISGWEKRVKPANEDLVDTLEAYAEMSKSRDCSDTQQTVILAPFPQN
jgi:hypothetical protein